MGKLLLINGANFSSNALDRVNVDTEWETVFDADITASSQAITKNIQMLATVPVNAMCRVTFGSAYSSSTGSFVLATYNGTTMVSNWVMLMDSRPNATHYPIPVSWSFDKIALYSELGGTIHVKIECVRNVEV